jgi:hypothetical protein
VPLTIIGSAKIERIFSCADHVVEVVMITVDDA